ncbi:MAG: hypothetical protein E7242_05815 [Lachnospiraceae bacterium]|nr:hypothetical protein [Lachnospiraceae bacterium]
MIKTDNGKVTIVGSSAELYHEMISIEKAYYEEIAREKTKFGAWLWMDRVNREVREHIEKIKDIK